MTLIDRKTNNSNKLQHTVRMWPMNPHDPSCVKAGHETVDRADSEGRPRHATVAPELQQHMGQIRHHESPRMVIYQPQM